MVPARVTRVQDRVLLYLSLVPKNRVILSNELAERYNLGNQGVATRFLKKAGFTQVFIGGYLSPGSDLRHFPTRFQLERARKINGRLKGEL